MKIFYFCPDLKFPSGGIKRLYSHVKILRDHDFDAYILHLQKGFKIDWFQHDVPVVFLNDNPPLDPGDTIVIPEGFPNIMKKIQGDSLNKVVIALSHSYIFHTLPKGENWRDYGVDTVITTSHIIADFIEWSMNIPNIHLIETSLDKHTFIYDPGRKRLQVAYVKRKDTNTEQVEKILKSKDDLFQNIDFIAIENLTFAQYAEVLKDSDIFLTTSAHEGLNRSLLEAMACGCICIGYHGIGGKEYIVGSGERQNFILAETMNYIELAKSLYNTVSKIQGIDPIINLIRQNALETASRFQSHSEEKSVLKFWDFYINNRQIDSIP